MSPYSQEERYLRQLLDHVSDAVVATDTHGRVTFANPAAQKLYGIAEEAAVGRGLLELLDLFDAGGNTDVDEITGFVTRGNGVSVHRADCVNLQHLLQSEPERLVGVRWQPREGSQFLVAIQVEALDRTGLLSDVTRTLSDQHVNILSATVATPSTSATCSARSAPSTASTTSTG